jgi:hypothetical protein
LTPTERAAIIPVITLSAPLAIFATESMARKSLELGSANMRLDSGIPVVDMASLIANVTISLKWVDVDPDGVACEICGDKCFLFPAKALRIKTSIPKLDCEMTGIVCGSCFDCLPIVCDDENE